ncbi:unnamed protein product [Protopolystoma xenopodis]|uniref:Uncharacterized protein n=1 Tax=Protopolystoma xenopodis TaxID=117903 RepID=A0A3S5AQ62_9PLAT|nr:unnamed protein product [Protopolystoma xenopodis]
MQNQLTHQRIGGHFGRTRLRLGEERHLRRAYAAKEPILVHQSKQLLKTVNSTTSACDQLLSKTECLDELAYITKENLLALAVDWLPKIVNKSIQDAHCLDDLIQAQCDIHKRNGDEMG